MSMAVTKQWTRVRTLGRGASGAEVFLAADDASGDLFAVKSAGTTTSGAAALRREQGIMSALRSPRVVSCVGGRAGRDGSYQLFLEYGPGGSLADEVARAGGLDERAVRGYAADVAAGLAYLHGAGVVHGDVKARNVVIGADGRAKLTDFGCARKSSCPIIGGTPAFMAPEVARGEQQGPAADVWALGCTVVEMATGRAPWSGMDGEALAAMHRIGYTDAVPDVPQWLSAEAKDFLGMCLVRRASGRCTAAQLLEHPFLASSAVFGTKLEDVNRKRVSPKSTLDAAFWDSESDSDDEVSHSTATERMKALACPASALPDWDDSGEGWMDVLSAPTEEAWDSDAASVPVEKTAGLDEESTREEPTGEEGCGRLGIAADCSSGTSVLVNVGEADDGSVWPHNRHHQSLENLAYQEPLLPCSKLQLCNTSVHAIDLVPAQTPCFALLLCCLCSCVRISLSVYFLCSPLRHVVRLANLGRQSTQHGNTVIPRGVAVTPLLPMEGNPRRKRMEPTRKAQQRRSRRSYEQKGSVRKHCASQRSKTSSSD